MGIEAILSELRNRKSTCFMSFRGLGMFYVDGYMHRFSAIAGERRDKKAVKFLEDRITLNPALKDYKINDNTSLGFDKKIPAFEVVQVEAPIWLGSNKNYTVALRKQGKIGEKEEVRTPLPEEFYTAHYKRGMEFSIGPVSAIYEVDDRLVDLLKDHSKLNEEYLKISEAIKRKHVLGKSLESYNGNNLDEILGQLSKKDREDNGARIRSFGDNLIELKKSLSEIGPSHIEYDPNHSCFDIHFDFDITDSKIPFEQREQRRWIRFKRMRNIDEILSDNSTNFDIEKFEFDSDDERVDLVVMLNYKDGKVSKKKLLTRYPTEKKSMNGFEIVYCEDAKDIVEKAKDYINGKGNEESFIITAYNAPFDTIQMREEGNFSIGNQESDPKKESTTKFFEKIGVYGKHVLDPLDIAKVLFAHLPNQKLEMVANELGVDFEKGINYRQGRELSITARTGKKEHLSNDVIKLIKEIAGKELSEITEDKLKESCSEILMNYATNDGDVMCRLQSTERFRKALEDRVFMSKLFMVDPFKIFHDPNRVNDAQERSYFDNVGVNRDDIYKRWKVMIQYERKAMNRFKKYDFKPFDRPNKRGLFSNVYKVYVPYARFLLESISKNFPLAKELVEYSRQFADDPLRQADLARHEDKLCKLMVQDYAICMMEADKLSELVKGIQNDKDIPDDSGLFGNFRKDLNSLFYKIRNHLKDTGNVNRYKDYNITLDLLEDCITKLKSDFLEKNKVSLKEMQRMFNQWAKLQDKERKVYGNYGIRAFSPGYYDKNIFSIEDALGWRDSAVFIYLYNNKFELLHQQGNYLYVKGDKNLLTSKDSPVIVVDELEKILITANPSDQRSRDKDESKLEQKVYYNKHGYFEGITLDEEPTDELNVFEMEAYGDFIDNMLKGNYAYALMNIHDQARRLNSGNVQKEELVWMSKSKKRYHAIEDGKKIYFYADKKLANGKDIKVDEENRREYVEESIGKKKVDGKWIDKMEKVYLMEIDRLKPDLEAYQERINSRIRDLLEPFVGEAYKRFIEERLTDEEILDFAKKIKVK